MTEFFNRLFKAVKRQRNPAPQPPPAETETTFATNLHELVEGAFTPRNDVRRTKTESTRPVSAEERFPRYEIFKNPETFSLWFRNQQPEWIGINIANATYNKGVNVSSSLWLAERKTTDTGMIIEIDPNLTAAAEAFPPHHMGRTDWANHHPDIQPVMVAGLTGDVHADLVGKVDMALVVAPAPMYKDDIIRDGYAMLKPGGEITAIFDPIISADENGQVDMNVIAQTLADCPGGTDILINGHPYDPEQPPTPLTVYAYKSEGIYPRTAYITDTTDYDLPVLVLQLKKPHS